MNRKEYLDRIEKNIREGRYQDTWESLGRHEVPDWYRRARLGIFLHWGPFSVPAYHDWYARNMYIEGDPACTYHRKTYGSQKEFGYKDLIPAFTMENFEPGEWVRLFREAGADYVVPVAEHHDGFANYYTELSPWNAVDKGPHRDILGDLLEAGDHAGLIRGASSHRAEHWFFFSNGRKMDSDVHDPMTNQDLYWPAMPEPADHHDLFSEPAPSQEFLEDWLLRCCELVDRYHPSVFYFDWWIQHQAFRPYLKKFTAYYYNVMEDRGGCVIHYKHDAYPFGVAVPDIERGQFSQAKPFLWQSDTSVMRNSWCSAEHLENRAYKEPIEILWDLIDVVSKNGRLLLNFGPGRDGTFNEQDLHILEVMRDWMKVNGEAIHGTELWRIQQEGPTVVQEGQFADKVSRNFTSEDIRFMCRDADIYAMTMRCPEDGQILIRSLRKADASRLPLFHGIVDSVDVLGMDHSPVWHRDEEGLKVDLGDYRSSLPVTVRIHTR